MSQPEPGAISHFLSAGHGATLSTSINALGGRGIVVDGDEGVRGETGSRGASMESASQVSRQLGIGLEVSGQRRQRSLRLGPAASAQRWKAHDGREA